jgi:hypothetical protein
MAVVYPQTVAEVTQTSPRVGRAVVAEAVRPVGDEPPSCPADRTKSSSPRTIRRSCIPAAPFGRRSAGPARRCVRSPATVAGRCAQWVPLCAAIDRSRTTAEGMLVG